MENTQKNQNQEKEAHNVPEKRFSTGAISATIWKNSTRSKEGTVFETRSVSLQRRYTDKSGKWQTSSSLRINDLPKATLVLEEAYRFLVLQEKSESAQSA
ncbi:MAG TPA: hypothetical protein VJJ82_03330 [Candidatus Nanoarchaeia archaeon]|nr:hypothetical protein [Candidatus Nanoarchaeia archaeon]